jgi:hypothetical protein
MLLDNPDRMTSIMAAMRSFIGAMVFPYDRIGIVSFGTTGTATVSPTSSTMSPGIDSNSSDDKSYIKMYYPGTNGGGSHNYNDRATVDIGLNSNPVNINATINSTIPGGKTPMRYALYKAINEMKANATPNSAAYHYITFRW